MQPIPDNSPRTVLKQACMIVVISGLGGLAHNALSPQGIPIDYRVVKAKQAAKTVQVAKQVKVPVIALAAVRAAAEEHTATFLDGRTPASFAAGHIPGARNLPVLDFKRYLKSATAGLAHDSPLVTYCSSSHCQSSVTLARMLREEGYTQVRAYIGGWQEWKGAKLRIAKGVVNRPATPQQLIEQSASPSVTVTGMKNPSASPSATTHAIPQTKVTSAVPTSPRKLGGPSRLPAHSTTNATVPATSPLVGLKEAFRLFNSGTCLFVDTRHKDDYLKEHVDGAVCLPLETFDESLPSVAVALSQATIIITYCDGVDCNSSVELAQKLHEMGFKEVRAFVGGWNEWKKARHPTRSGEEER
ncbi:MAG: hypothetical protein HY318_00950 [Armatimonadetes bacterium]|nr:hypothetical protein [Armatimonadota bacterium]